MCHIDEIGVGDWLPEDEGLVVHLPNCLVSWVVERLEQFISSISRKQDAEVLNINIFFKFLDAIASVLLSCETFVTSIKDL